MKQYFLLLVSIMFLLFSGCKDDGDKSYPDSATPEIIVGRDDLYSVPNRKFVIKANLKDDLGLKSLKINIPEFYLDKEISFPVDTLITDYQLAYEFLAPNDTQKSDKYTVNLTLTDVSGNSVSKALTLNLDGDFDAPAIDNIKPADGSVLFQAEEMQLKVSFDVTDASGISYIEVKADNLGIDEKVTLTGEKVYHFDKTYSIPSELKSYEMEVKTIDTFIEPNEATKTVHFSISKGLPELYLADVPKSTSLTDDIFGIPMYCHTKSDGVFTFKYYADKDNKEIYLLGQASSFEPHCFGTIGGNKLENSTESSPIILPEKGYYEIVVNVTDMTYSATKYIPTSPTYDPAQITICGNGIENGGWDPNNTDLLLTANPDNPYQLERVLTLNGGDVAMTITSPDWGSPWWRLDANGSVIFLGGGNFSYTGAVGTYKFIMDTELGRAVLIKQ